MSSAPHPALRRILAAASAPGRCLESLDAAAPDLAALARDLEGAAVVVDRALEPLARGIDLAAVLGRAAAPRDRAEARATDAVRRSGGVPHGESLPSDPPRRIRRETAPERGEIPSVPLVPHDAAAVAAVLSRFSGGADAKAGSHGSISGESEPSRSTRPTGTTSTSADAPGRWPASADTTEAGRRLLSREEATAELRRRTVAVAGDGALDTPVQVGEPAAGMAELLRDSADGGRRTAGDGRAPSAERPVAAPSTPSPRPDRAARDDGHLHEVLERVRSAAARRPVAAGGARPATPEMDPFEDGDGARGNGSDVAGADPPRAPRPAAVAAAGGLRGLAQRAEAAGQVLAPRGVTFSSTAAEPAAGVVAARADEAELAERIDRLLRREARRQGIDLEGVGP